MKPRKDLSETEPSEVAALKNSSIVNLHNRELGASENMAEKLGKASEMSTEPSAGESEEEGEQAGEGKLGKFTDEMEKESNEHPSMPHEDIVQIVADHFKNNDAHNSRNEDMKAAIDKAKKMSDADDDNILRNFKMKRGIIKNEEDVEKEDAMNKRVDNREKLRQSLK